MKACSFGQGNVLIPVLYEPPDKRDNSSSKNGGAVKVGKLHLYRASRLGLYRSHFRRSNLPFSTVFYPQQVMSPGSATHHGWRSSKVPGAVLVNNVFGLMTRSNLRRYPCEP